MTYVAVLSATGKKLQPTSAYKARKLLKKGEKNMRKYLIELKEVGEGFEVYINSQ